MIKVPLVSTETINGWSLSEAGLPARAVNCGARAGIRSVGDLRLWKAEDLLALRSFGIRTLRQTRNFFRLSRQLAAGTLEFADLKQILQEFALAAQIQVLVRRYGLKRTTPTASRDAETLQEIADDYALTRERVRQTEAAGLARLRCKLPTSCLEPLVRSAEEFLRFRGGVATSAEVAAWPGAAAFAPYNPPAALLLIADLVPGRISFLNNLFTVAHAETLVRIETRARECLAAAPGPTTLAAIMDCIGTELPSVFQPDPRAVMGQILAHMKEVLCTRDDRFLLDDHADRLAATLLSEHAGEALHFDKIAGILNGCLTDRSALSSTQVLMRLSRSPLFERADRGLYRLRAGSPDGVTRIAS